MVNPVSNKPIENEKKPSQCAKVVAWRGRMVSAQLLVSQESRFILDLAKVVWAVARNVFHVISNVATLGLSMISKKWRRITANDLQDSWKDIGNFFMSIPQRIIGVVGYTLGLIVHPVVGEKFEIGIRKIEEGKFRFIPRPLKKLLNQKAETYRFNLDLKKEEIPVDHLKSVPEAIQFLKDPALDDHAPEVLVAMYQKLGEKFKDSEELKKYCAGHATVYQSLSKGVPPPDSQSTDLVEEYMKVRVWDQKVGAFLDELKGLYAKNKRGVIIDKIKRFEKRHLPQIGKTLATFVKVLNDNRKWVESLPEDTGFNELPINGLGSEDLWQEFSDKPHPDAVEDPKKNLEKLGDIINEREICLTKALNPELEDGDEQPKELKLINNLFYNVRVIFTERKVAQHM